MKDIYITKADCPYFPAHTLVERASTWAKGRAWFRNVNVTGMRVTLLRDEVREVRVDANGGAHADLR